MTWKYSNYSKISPNAERHFPFTTPRRYQLETISEIEDAITKGYRYIVLEAGTGSGKSAVAAALSGMFDSTYILTITKQLQDQYLRDFANLGFTKVKGRSNFKCKKYSEDGIKQTCEFGRCAVEGYPCRYSLKNHADGEITRENTCEYYYQKYMGLTSQTTVANYPYMFLELNYVEDFKKRDLMILDEAHNIESMIMNQLTLEFDRHDLKEYVNFNLSKERVDSLNSGDYTDWINFITEIRNRYESELSKIEDIDRPYLIEKKMFIKNQIANCSRFLDQFQLNPEMWIFDYDREFAVAQFKPLKVDSYAYESIFRYADVCIFMSATILDYRLFARWLGISPDEIYAIRRKSPFDIKRNPIKTCGDYNMSYSHLEKSAPETLDAINDILNRHKNEKGIIHTVSGQCRDFLVDNIATDRFIFHDVENRSQVIDEFKDCEKPLVLVSPSVGEGVDLPGDECRFQIIYKIPYPDLGDKQVAMRNALDSKWYEYRTSLAMVQAHGRGMRFEDDYCTTYFIDSRLKGFVRDDASSNNFIPDTFRQAIDGFSDGLENFNENQTFEESEELKRKMDLKYDLIEKGNRMLASGESERAIRFYMDLVDNELFSNDAYCYLKLAEAYDDAYMYDEETRIIIRFLKSGIYASDDTVNAFKKRLKRLDGMGYFDYESDMEELEYEFQNAKKLSKANLTVTFPSAEKIIEIKKG